MIYRTTWKQGNGYRCSCCRYTYLDSHDSDTREQADSFIETLRTKKQSLDTEINDITDVNLLVIESEEEIYL